MTASVTRRAALKVLGAAPFAGGVELTRLGASKPEVDPRAADAAPDIAPRFFTAHEWATVRLLADYVIPRDARSGSATDAKVPEHIDFLLSQPETNVQAQVAMHGGLAWLDHECGKRFNQAFVQSTDAQRRQVLDDIAWPKTAAPDMGYGVAFFNQFRNATAAAFFTSAIGWRDLGYVGNVSNPGYEGCPPEALARLGVSYDLMRRRKEPSSK